jgi:hypothetical protein
VGVSHVTMIWDWSYLQPTRPVAPKRRIEGIIVVF